MEMRKRYWERPADELHKALFDTYSLMRDAHSKRCDEYRDRLSLYLGKEVRAAGYGDGLYHLIADRLGGLNPSIVLNATKNAIETICARICTPPRVQAVTDEGDYTLKRRAKDLGRWVDGVSARCRVDTPAQQSFRDGCIDGTGATYIGSAHGRIITERVLPTELMTDPLGSYYGNPRDLFRVRMIDADMLAALYPEHAGAIMRSAQKEGVVTTGTRRVFADMVLVLEAWHLPSSPDADDGVWMRACDGCLLERRAWSRSRFPFAFIRWNDPQFGFWGAGAVDDVAGLQIEANNLIGRVAESMDLNATQWVFYQQGSIDEEHLTNKPGQLIPFNGPVAPHAVTPPSMSSEVYQHLWNIAEQIYRTMGVSMMSASSTKPAGVESGVAFRTLQDIETQRFALASKAWDQHRVDIAELMIEEGRELAARGGGVDVDWIDRDRRRRIKWSDVNLDRDQFTLRVYPSALLPTLPGGKMATVQEMTAAGWIEKRDAMALLDFPDLARFTSLQTANTDAVDAQIESLIESDEPMEPSDWQDLSYALERVQLERIRVEADGAPVDVLERFDEWLAHANEKRKLAMMAMQAEQMPQQAPMPMDAAAAMGGAM